MKLDFEYTMTFKNYIYQGANKNVQSYIFLLNKKKNFITKRKEANTKFN